MSDADATGRILAELRDARARAVAAFTHTFTPSTDNEAAEACTNCGTPYEDCVNADPGAEWADDGSDSDDLLCCVGCEHPVPRSAGYTIATAYAGLMETALKELARPTLLERGPLSSAEIFQAAREKGCYPMRNGAMVHVKPGCRCSGGAT